MAAAVTAALTSGRPRLARSASTPIPATTPAHTPANSTPRNRESRYIRLSRAAALDPNTATGCPFRGSPTMASTPTPTAIPTATAPDLITPAFSPIPAQSAQTG
ncbi:hypothetical protein Acor_18430 [Acrocarpospora corrugata]|uniref:Uncharacterized protein n=1 Tax=Acrocarpospora corrugata TaxID=35763 RepID=A0A5M3VV41_9ACTN|nr:hypothetical protein Acor_18430 [Acrocarpospora corrugata]